jgi:hypothetical protein
MDDVLAAASTWSQPRGRRSESAATAKARQRFVSHCRNLLRHIGWGTRGRKAPSSQSRPGC